MYTTNRPQLPDFDKMAPSLVNVLTSKFWSVFRSKEQKREYLAALLDTAYAKGRADYAREVAEEAWVRVGM